MVVVNAESPRCTKRVVVVVGANPCALGGGGDGGGGGGDCRSSWLLESRWSLVVVVGKDVDLVARNESGGGCSKQMTVVSAELSCCSKVRECGPLRSEEEEVEWRRWRLGLALALSCAYKARGSEPRSRDTDRRLVPDPQEIYFHIRKDLKFPASDDLPLLSLKTALRPRKECVCVRISIIG